MSCVAVDLFCGVGGLTHGLIKSGVSVIAGVDIDASCQYAYEENNASDFILADIQNFSSDQLRNMYPKDAIRVLVGCAPCQPFSKYTQRYRKGGHTSDKWKLLYSFTEMIYSVLPEIVSMENVPDLAGEQVFSDFVEGLNKVGYKTSWSIVNCPDYGVPQNRKRLVLLASKLGAINLIPPMYSPDQYLSVKDAIGELPSVVAGSSCPSDPIHRAAKLSTMNLKRIQQSKPGGTWRDWDESLQLECHKKDTGRTYPSVYGRMKWNEPSPTITTQFYGYGSGRFGHPEQDRALTLREGAVLQSFPKTYAFVSPNDSVSKKRIGTHIGNAVPVKLGEAI